MLTFVGWSLATADAVAQRSLLSYHLVSDSPFHFLVGYITNVRIINDFYKFFYIYYHNKYNNIKQYG